MKNCLFLIFLSLTFCKSASKPGELVGVDDDIDLHRENTDWILKELNGKPIVSTAADQRIIFQFVKDSVKGYSHCSNYAGTSVIRGKGLTLKMRIDPLRCSSSTETEKQQLTNLDNTDRFSIDHRTLNLKKGSESLAKFEVFFQTKY